MIKKNIDFIVENENAVGGLGNFTMRHALIGSELPAHVKLVCEVIIKPGEDGKYLPNISEYHEKTRS